MNTMNSVNPLIEIARDFADHKHDTVVPSLHMSVAEDASLVLLPNGLDGAALRLTMEDNATNQLGGRLGIPFWGTGSKRTLPADFYRHMRDTMPMHFSQFSNSLLAKTDGNWLVRGYDDHARAILTDIYTTVDNLELLEMTSTVLSEMKNTPYSIVQSGAYYARNDGVQRDEMSIRVVVSEKFPRDEDGSYGLGFVLRNGETGGGSAEVRPLVMRTSCMNSIVLKQGADGMELGTRVTHRGSRDAKLTLLAAAIVEALPMAVEGLEKFLLTKRRQIDLAGVIAKMGEDHDWGDSMRLAVAVGSEGHQSVYGLVNGLTFAAHELEMNMTDRLNLESMAATFVYRPELVKQAT